MKNQNRSRRILQAGAFAVMALGAMTPAFAQSDITGVITEVSGYKTAAIVVGVAILLFTLGRAVVRKLAK